MERVSEETMKIVGIVCLGWGLCRIFQFWNVQYDAHRAHSSEPVDPRPLSMIASYWVAVSHWLLAEYRPP